MAPKHSGERSCSEISIQAKGPRRDKETQRKKYDKVDADVNCVNSTDSATSSPMAKSATPANSMNVIIIKERNRISTKTVDVLTSLRKHYRECAPFEIGPVESDANHRNEETALNSIGKAYCGRISVAPLVQALLEKIICTPEAPKSTDLGTVVSDVMVRVEKGLMRQILSTRNLRARMKRLMGVSEAERYAKIVPIWEVSLRLKRNETASSAPTRYPARFDSPVELGFRLLGKAIVSAFS
ncbi:hypothetical protein EVAR_90746_1 [Eumeta japonica]|uniref:Uncharacterized protein n=1 Tax=Eumeta variegata TaxID=151549 RepID=A0A4C1ZD93_EUMVA|nr:hypothetical protein EVAR_90746_1 [Eumeta japonica]